MGGTVFWWVREIPVPFGAREEGGPGDGGQYAKLASNKMKSGLSYVIVTVQLYCSLMVKEIKCFSPDLVIAREALRCARGKICCPWQKRGWVVYFFVSYTTPPTRRAQGDVE